MFSPSDVADSGETGGFANKLAKLNSAFGAIKGDLSTSNMADETPAYKLSEGTVP